MGAWAQLTTARATTQTWLLARVTPQTELPVKTKLQRVAQGLSVRPAAHGGEEAAQPAACPCQMSDGRCLQQQPQVREVEHGLAQDPTGVPEEGFASGPCRCSGRVDCPDGRRVGDP